MQSQTTKATPVPSVHRTLLGGELAFSRTIHVAALYPNVLNAHQSGERARAQGWSWKLEKEVEPFGMFV
jgi:hypothetical protein